MPASPSDAWITSCQAPSMPGPEPERHMRQTLRPIIATRSAGCSVSASPRFSLPIAPSAASRSSSGRSAATSSRIGCIDSRLTSSGLRSEPGFCW